MEIIPIRSCKNVLDNKSNILNLMTCNVAVSIKLFAKTASVNINLWNSKLNIYFSSGSV